MNRRECLAKLGAVALGPVLVGKTVEKVEAEETPPRSYSFDLFIENTGDIDRGPEFKWWTKWRMQPFPVATVGMGVGVSYIISFPVLESTKDGNEVQFRVTDYGNGFLVVTTNQHNMKYGQSRWFVPPGRTLQIEQNIDKEPVKAWMAEGRRIDGASWPE